jgi:hypothetical protein
MASLYEIDAALRAIFATVENAEGELTPELETQLTGLEMDRLIKLDNILAYRQDILRQGESFKAEIQRLKVLQQTADNMAGRLKLYVENSMMAAGEEKHELARFKVWIQNNPPGVKALPDDINSLPAEYRITQPDKVDGKGLIEAWKAGKTLPAGVRVEQTKSLRVK